MPDPHHTSTDGSRAEGVSDAGEDEGDLLWHTKLEGLAAEYQQLLRESLEKQRGMYGEQLARAREGGRREGKGVREALEKEERAVARKFENAKQRRDKIVGERDFLRDLVASVEGNREANERQVAEAKRELAACQEMRSKTLPLLTAKIEGLMLKLDGGG
jgi:hypothetical protein